MYHCYEHGIDHRQLDCPKCVAQKRHEEVIDALKSQAEAQAEALAEAEYRRFNPGEYVCPHCLYKTLIRNASRCRDCHGTIDRGYWDGVVLAEEQAAKRRQQEEDRRLEEWERAKPDRERVAEQRARAALHERILIWVGGGIVVFLPLLSALTASVINAIIGAGDIGGPLVAFAVPGFNYLVLLPALLYSAFMPGKAAFFVCVVCWAFIAAGVFRLAARTKG